MYSQEETQLADLFDNLSQTLLMGPGPSCVPPAVYEALARPTIGHLDPRFIAIMDEIKAMLRELLQTDNALTLPISGTGSAGMETCFVNLVEPGNRVIAVDGDEVAVVEQVDAVPPVLPMVRRALSTLSLYVV